VKFCQKEKLKIKILYKLISEVSVARSGEKKRKRKNHQILIFSSHCLAKKKEKKDD
jgi:hypothetical protein